MIIPHEPSGDKAALMLLAPAALSRLPVASPHLLLIVGLRLASLAARRPRAPRSRTAPGAGRNGPWARSRRLDPIPASHGRKNHWKAPRSRCLADTGRSWCLDVQARLTCPSYSGRPSACKESFWIECGGQPGDGGVIFKCGTQFIPCSCQLGLCDRAVCRNGQ